MHDYSAHMEAREQRRQFLRRNFLWMAPLAILAAVGLFFGLGNLVAWLWKVTVADIFGWKLISFWQAWGLVLLSQILFKAHIQRHTGMGRMRPRGLMAEAWERHTSGDAAPGGTERTT